MWFQDVSGQDGAPRMFGEPQTGFNKKAEIGASINNEKTNP